MRQQYTIIIGFMLMLSWTAVGEAASDYEQEIWMYYLTPCYKTGFTEFLESPEVAENFKELGWEWITADHILMFFDKGIRELSQKRVDAAKTRVHGRSERDRLAMYVALRRACINDGRTNFVPDLIATYESMTTCKTTEPSSTASDHKEVHNLVPEREVKDRDEVARFDIFQGADRRHVAVPQHIRQKVLAQCQKEMDTVGAASWWLIRQCVVMNLDSYLGLKRTYGDSLRDE